MKLRSRRSTRRPFAILDMGSTKICCMIGEIDRQGELRLLGQGTHASAGMRAGEVTALTDLGDAIGQAVQSAERAADRATDAEPMERETRSHRATRTRASPALTHARAQPPAAHRPMPEPPITISGPTGPSSVR